MAPVFHNNAPPPPWFSTVLTLISVIKDLGCSSSKAYPSLGDHWKMILPILNSVWCSFSKMFFLWPAIHLSLYMRNAKKKVYGRVFRVTFFAFRISFFAFCIISCQGWHSCEMSKGVVVFFAALIKFEKCTMGVLYFMMCFAKTFAKCEIG